MATGNVTVTTAAAMIPEIWLPQIDLTLQKSLKFMPLTRNVVTGGTKGDVVHIPKLGYAVARDKAASTEYTFDVENDTDGTVAINQHKYSARRIDGIVRVQSSYDQVAARVQQVVYPVADAIDIGLASLYTGITNSVDGGVLSTTTAVAKIMEVWSTLQTANAPEEGRYLVVAPAVAAVLLQTSGFISRDYIVGTPVSSGVIGTLYGIEIVVSNNIQTTGGQYVCMAGVVGVTLGMALAKAIEVRAWDEPRGGHDTVGFSAEAIYGVGVMEAASGCKFLVDV